MEMFSILVLISILSIIFLLTYFLNLRQKRALRKITTKQEPRFDLVEDSTRTNFTTEDEISDNFVDDQEESVNLLMQADTVVIPKPVPKSPEPETPKKEKASVEEIIYLMLVAKPNKPYVGYELLQALLAAGLRFGQMNLFHRHEDAQGNGKILFSLASASEQGTFELNKIGAFSGKGLILFQKLSSQRDLINAFDIMLETGKQLVEDLGGEILDDERNPINNDKIEKIKNKIREFEQKQLIGDLFDE